MILLILFAVNLFLGVHCLFQTLNVRELRKRVDAIAPPRERSDKYVQR